MAACKHGVPFKAWDCTCWRCEAGYEETNLPTEDGAILLASSEDCPDLVTVTAESNTDESALLLLTVAQAVALRDALDFHIARQQRTVPLSMAR